MKLSKRHLARRRGLPAGRPRRARRAVARRLSCRMAAASVMAALAVGLTAVPAFALTWTVHPGGPFTGTATPGSTAITDSTTSSTVTCNRSKITGSLLSGNQSTGHHIATITGATFTGCTATTFGAATVTAAGLPWFVNAVGYASPITHGRVTGIHLNVVAGGCSASVDGTTANANDGKINFQYSNADFGLKFTPAAASLVFSSATGCGTTFALSDPATYVASYFPITPHQTIISP